MDPGPVPANNEGTEAEGLSALTLRALIRGDRDFRDIIEALPAAIYMTDAAGKITFYNQAAVDMWGRRPELGRSEFCGSWKLFHPDGRPMPHDQCPMAVSLREKRPVRGVEAIGERPDGSRVSFMPYPTPLFDRSGELVGAINMLIDTTERRQAIEVAQHYSAIVESSDDAILTKDLNGVITSWNRAAERLFGFTAAEAVGQPVTILIPLERHDEETDIIGRLRRGLRIDHYETVRQRKDGTLIDISLTVSPIRGSNGQVIGASKIARDITERRRAQEQQVMLVREMDHRLKNLFMVAGSVVSLSAASATTTEELALSIRERLAALARAHALTLSTARGGEFQATHATLHALIAAVLSPYVEADEMASRITIGGKDPVLSRGAISSFALLIHEFATNAAKYGALSTHAGRLDIDVAEEGDLFVLTWKERGGPATGTGREAEGFGSVLARVTVKGQLGGDIARTWEPEGLTIRITALRARLEN